MQGTDPTEPADSLDESFLADLEPSLKNEIRQRAVVRHHRSGDVIVTQAEGRWTGIVLSGMARVFIRTPAGRQVTLRHPQQGATIGIGTLLDGGAVSAQAVTPCAVMELDHRQVLQLAETHPALGLAIARELTAALFDTYREIVILEHGSVRQRVARQLLHFAGELDPERPLVIPITHEELAEAVGSAREVVTRQLARFQAEKMLALERAEITLLDPEQLADAAKQAD